MYEPEPAAACVSERQCKPEPAETALGLQDSLQTKTGEPAQSGQSPTRQASEFWLSELTCLRLKAVGSNTVTYILVLKILTTGAYCHLRTISEQRKNNEVTFWNPLQGRENDICSKQNIQQQSFSSDGDFIRIIGFCRATV